MDTPIPQIILAAEGKMDFMVKTNPFGGAPQKKQGKKQTVSLNAQREKLALMQMHARDKHRDKQCQKQQNAS